MNSYVLLALSIIGEVFGSSLLKASNGFRNLLPSLGVVAGYAAAFYMLSITLTELPIGTVYAIWSGAGTDLTAMVGVMLYKEAFNLKKMMVIMLIIIGVILLNI